MKLSQCYNFHDFRRFAKKRLPSPIFNYIDGAADDEVTYLRNTSSYNDVDLIPNVLAGVEKVDLSTTIFDKRISMPLFCAPTAVQRLFHHEGEKAGRDHDGKKSPVDHELSVRYQAGRRLHGPSAPVFRA